MITSTDNEKLKRIRRLHQRKHREREDAFVTEGEDLLEAGRAAGVEPLELITLAGEGLGGDEASADALASVAQLASGTRAIAVWRRRWSEPRGPVCVYLHGLGDPGNVGTLIRTALALVDGAVVVGPGCADPYSPKAVRATMGAIFDQPLARGTIADTPHPRAALVAHGGAALERLSAPVTICLGAEREGLPSEVTDQCDLEVTIRLRPGVESLNVAAAGAIALQRLSSRAEVRA